MAQKTREQLEQKFEHLFEQISKKSFLNMSSIGGEVPFYITTHLPQNHNKVVPLIEALKKKLDTKGVSVLEINLFDLSISIIEEEDDLEDIFETEKGESKSGFLETMQSMLDVESDIAPSIARQINSTEHDVLFITGVGQVFPIIRSHNILNNLQRISKKTPMVMFFPGEYNHTQNKSYLKLFNLFKDDNYYRAFNLDSINL